MASRQPFEERGLSYPLKCDKTPCPKWRSRNVLTVNRQRELFLKIHGFLIGRDVENTPLPFSVYKNFLASSLEPHTSLPECRSSMMANRLGIESILEEIDNQSSEHGKNLKDLESKLNEDLQCDNIRQLPRDLFNSPSCPISAKSEMDTEERFDKVLQSSKGQYRYSSDVDELFVLPGAVPSRHEVANEALHYKDHTDVDPVEVWDIPDVTDTKTASPKKRMEILNKSVGRLFKAKMEK